jgi:hypothetical integral membrane protein (TIGR02206 family)
MTSEGLFDASSDPPSFHALNTQHIVVLAIVAILCLLVFWASRRCRPSGQRWLGYLLGLFLISYAGAFYILQGIRHALSWKYSLPLDPCSLVLIACIICLFRPIQSLFEIAYFWGLGGILQALATPDLAAGFPSWEFVLFFWGHGTSLMAILFFIAGRNLRPRRSSIFLAMMALNFYALAVGVINAIAGWNYGYLCGKPYEPSLLDYLGSWPWYLLSLECVAFLTFLLLDLPWRYKKALSG